MHNRSIESVSLSVVAAQSVFPSGKSVHVGAQEAPPRDVPRIVIAITHIAIRPSYSIAISADWIAGQSIYFPFANWTWRVTVICRERKNWRIIHRVRAVGCHLITWRRDTKRGPIHSHVSVVSLYVVSIEAADRALWGIPASSQLQLARIEEALRMWTLARSVHVRLGMTTSPVRGYARTRWHLTS